jgi:hypothetical protein
MLKNKKANNKGYFTPPPAKLSKFYPQLIGGGAIHLIPLLPPPNGIKIRPCIIEKIEK